MELPDDTMVSMRFVKQHFILRSDAAQRDMTTAECSAEFGHSPNWWQDQARAGRIAGCYQASRKSPWYIPRQQAMLFLSVYKQSKLRKGKRHQSASRWQAAAS